VSENVARCSECGRARDDVPRCPACGEPIVEHHVTRWYGRRYDVWSLRMAEDGMTCFVVDWARYPHAFRPKKAPRERRR